MRDGVCVDVCVSVTRTDSQNLENLDASYGGGIKVLRRTCVSRELRPEGSRTEARRHHGAIQCMH